MYLPYTIIQPRHQAVLVARALVVVVVVVTATSSNRLTGCKQYQFPSTKSWVHVAALFSDLFAARNKPMGTAVLPISPGHVVPDAART